MTTIYSKESAIYDLPKVLFRMVVSLFLLVLASCSNVPSKPTELSVETAVEVE